LVVHIAGDPDGQRTQDQGYVVALAKQAFSEFFVIAHWLSTSEAEYCPKFRKLNHSGKFFSFQKENAGKMTPLALE
jgi:hypothetical protein